MMECPCPVTNDSCSHLLVTSRRKKISGKPRLATSGNQSQNRECHSMFKPDITKSLAIGMVQSQLRRSTECLLQRSEQLFVMLADFIRRSFASKVGNDSWIGSVQGAVATWSVISMRYFLTILDSHGLTRSLSLPVLTRSKCDSYF